MEIHPADQPLLEQQDEDSFEAWQKRRLKEAEQPWTLPDDAVESKEAARGSSTRESSSATYVETLT